MKIFAQKACSAVHQTAIGQKNQKVDKQLHSRVHGDKIQGLLYYNYIVHNMCSSMTPLME